MPQATEDIRGVMIQLVGTHALLPNATVSEVITLSEPEPVANAPAWLLGRVPWQGWRVPLFSFGVLTGWTEYEPRETARVCILKAFGGHKRVPYMAMLAQGFPRLTTLSPDIVVPVETDEQPPEGVTARVTVHGDVAMIPDMMSIEGDVAEILRAADTN